MFKDGEVELGRCSGVKSDGGERVECSIRINRCGEVASVLGVVVLSDDPARVEIVDAMKVLYVGNECG